MKWLQIFFLPVLITLFNLPQQMSPAGPAGATGLPDQFPASVDSSLSQDDFTCQAVTEIPATECEALVAFYQSTNGRHWQNNEGWLVTNAPSGWFGVGCVHGHVNYLNMENNGLQGNLPSELGNLARLQAINLPLNQLSGPMPSALGKLTGLQKLMLQQNRLSGHIPPTFGHLASMQELSLGGNQLRGSIPAELGDLANLQILSLDDNQLTGPIPPELARAANLERLYLHRNQLSGPIPPALGDLVNLRHLTLANNHLRGPIPAELGNLTKMEILHLAHNQLSGGFPAELANLTRLEQFEADYHSLICAPSNPGQTNDAGQTSLLLTSMALNVLLLTLVARRNRDLRDATKGTRCQTDICSS